MPSHSNFAAPIQQNLKHHNFDIKFIDSSPEHLKRIKIPLLHSIYHYFRQFFLSDSTYKAKIKKNLKHQMISQKIQMNISNTQSDYTLVIRPDLFSLEHLNILKTKSNQNFIGYQWNGLARFPDTFLSINKFNRFFIFDNMDLSNPEYKKYNLIGTTNFYFDMYHPQPVAHQGTVAYFVGLHFDERSQSLDHCAKVLTEHGIKLDFNVRALKDVKNAYAQYKNAEIKFIKKNIEFDENLARINQADILVDVVNPVHHGLSFRTFEALYYGKKLITNNAVIQHYDFYHPDNILIWDGQDLSNITSFLARPYVQIDKNIVEKYSFENWIKNILDLPPYQKIELPKTDVQ